MSNELPLIDPSIADDWLKREKERLNPVEPPRPQLPVPESPKPKSEYYELLR